MQLRQSGVVAPKTRGAAAAAPGKARKRRGEDLSLVGQSYKGGVLFVHDAPR